MRAAIDSQGRCSAHPFVQLRRQSKRTGEWKSLLDSCPICAVDTGTPAGPFKEEKEELPLSNATPLPLKKMVGQEKPRKEEDGDRINSVPQRSQRFLAPGRRNHSNKRSSSVKSQGPRLRDASIDSRLSIQLSRPESRNSISSSQGHGRRHCSRERSTSKGRNVSIKDASRESMRFLRSQFSRQSLQPNSREIQGKKRPGGASLDSGRSSSRPRYPSAVSRRSCQSYSRNPQSEPRRSSRDGIGSNDPNDEGDEARARLDPEEHMRRPTESPTPHASNLVLALPPARSNSDNGPGSGRGLSPDPPLACGNSFGSVTSRRATFPSPFANSNSVDIGGQIVPVPPPPPPPPQLQPHTLVRCNSSVGSGVHHQPIMVFAMPGQEVPTLTISLQSPPGSTVVTSPAPSKKSEKRSSGRVAEVKNHGDDKEADGNQHEDDTSWCLPMIDTADFDSKGRCVRHPHVKLRKRKFLGGWRVLMSACPDCCVDEFNRIRCVEQVKRRRRERKEGEKRGRSRSSGRGTSSPSPGASGRSGSSCRSGSSRCSESSRHSGSTRRSRSSSGGSGDPSPRCSPSSDDTFWPRSPSPDITFKKLRPPGPSADGSIGTASLTATSSVSDGGTAGTARVRTLTRNTWKKETSGRLKEPYPQGRSRQARQQSSRNPTPSWPQRRGTILVRSIWWTDPEDGRAGRYTGEANSMLVPHGWGEMEYEGAGTREGEWDDGRYRGRSLGTRPGSGSRGRGPGLGGRLPSLRQRAQPRRRVLGT